MYIIIKSYNNNLINQVLKLFIINQKIYENYTIINLPKSNKFFSLIKSPHVFNKSRTKLSHKLYKSIIKFKNKDMDLENILKSINIAGVFIEVKKRYKYDK